MANRMDDAAAEIRAALQDDPAFRELAKSHRLLAQTALVKAKGYDPEDAEDDDEWDAEEENDEKDLDEDEDEDQNADDPDANSGVDDLRGTTKKSRVKKSRRKSAEDAEDDLVRAKLRIKKAERAEEDAEDADDIAKARHARKMAEKDLNRARGKLQRAKPAWVGDEDAEAADSRSRRKTAQKWYAEDEDAYFTNEDADHEEDGTYPPDGPEVADGDDTDQYSIGAHKVRSQRAMRRSQQGLPSKERLMKSIAEDGRITEDLLDAAPAIEMIAELLGDQANTLAKSARMLSKHDQVLGLLARGVVAQGKVIQKLAKSVAVMEHQVPGAPMFGMPPAFGVLAGGKEAKRGNKLQKSRSDVLLDAEDAMARGLIDSNTLTAMGRAQSVDDMVGMVPAAVQTQLGWK